MRYREHTPPLTLAPYVDCIWELTSEGEPHRVMPDGDHGYADQAHLIRDFPALAGITPAAYAMSEIGNPASMPPTIVST